MKSTYRNLVAKLNAARVRRETLHGREYLVVPTTIMRPDSVMNGSKGPLFYPRGEVAKHPGAWNGMPLLLNHPTTGSTGRTPENVRKHGLGYVYNDRVTRNGNRAVDAWFDVKLVRAHDARLPEGKQILPRLESGQPIDVSTGLFTDDRPHTSYSKNALKDFRGRRYEGDVATNYRPDHLAVLPTVKGACSAKDGCGTGVENAGRKYKRDAEGKFAAGDSARFSGKSADSTVEGDMDVKIINPHSNAHLVTKTDSSGRMYAGAFQHLPTATVERPEQKRLSGEVRPAKRFEAYHHTLRKITGNAKKRPSSSLDMSPDKACKIVEDGSVNGHPLTSAQRGMFGARCGTKNSTEGSSDTNDEGTTMTRRDRKAKQVKYLTANCECWKGDKAKALNSLADDVVDGLYRKLKDDEAKDAALNAVRAELGLAEDAEVTQELVANALNEKACGMAEEMGEGKGEAPMEGKKKGAKVMNSADADDTDDTEEGATVDLKDVFKQLPPEQQASLNRMFKRDKARKVAVINELKSIAKATRNSRKKDRIEEKLANNAATIEDLEELLDLVGEDRPKRNSTGDGGLDFLDEDGDEPRLNDYRAMGGGGPRRDEDDELLREPTENEADGGSDMDGDAGDYASYGRNRFANDVALNGHAKK